MIVTTLINYWGCTIMRIELSPQLMSQALIAVLESQPTKARKNYYSLVVREAIVN